MKPALLCLMAGSLFVTGCCPASATNVIDNAPSQTAAVETVNPIDHKSQEVVWDLSLVDGGAMFQDVRQFEDYVCTSTIAASGVLTDWNGTKGGVRLDTVFHGEVHDKTMEIVGTGGIVRPKVGERVLLLVNERDGEFKLHSFCAASGLFVYSKELEHFVQSAFAEKR